jgi:hypothetical protein
MRILERIFLHIGVEKTGTKTLQLMMALNRDLLRQHGFVYPTLPGPEHRGLPLYAGNDDAISHMRSLAGLAEGDRYAEFIDQFPSRLAAAVTAPDVHTALLSNEHCSSHLTTVEELGRLHRLLSPLARDSRVIIYLRRQDELAVSRYSANMKAGHTSEFGFTDEPYWFDYLSLLDKWAEVFGAHNLLIRVFEPAQMHRAGLLADFSSAIGFEPYELLQHPPNQNTSLDVYSLEFLRRFNMHVPVLANGRPNPNRGAIAEAMAAMSSSDRLAPAADAAIAFLGKFAASNAEVARKYLNRADGVLFMQRPSPDRHERLPFLDVEKAVEIATKLWERQEMRFHKQNMKE